MEREKEDKKSTKYIFRFCLVVVLSQGGPVITETTTSSVIGMTLYKKIFVRWKFPYLGGSLLGGEYTGLGETK